MANDDRRRTADKFRWLDQVGADHNLTLLDFRLAYAISTYVNRGTGDAWPSQPRLAAECNATDRAIRDAIARLRDGGHLEVTGKGGRGLTSRLRPVLKESEKRNDASTLSPEKAEDSFRDSEAKPGSKRTKTRKQKTLNPEANDMKRGSQLPTIPKKEPIEKTAEGKSLMVGSNDFDAFWAIFPKKVDKLKAEKLYTAIIKTKRATAAELLAGAKRYATAKAGTERRFIKHPTTWLNAGAWLDEPEPNSPTPTNRADSAIAGMRRFLDLEPQQ